MNLSPLLDWVLHVDKQHLEDLIRNYGSLVYFLLAAIVFSETGLVVTFFLPGDTLLFIGGAICAGGGMNIWFLMALLIVAAVSGSTLNYWIGSYIGHKVFTHNYRWIDQDALKKTHAFYERFGGVTMVLSRFVPVVRTFAPFVAGGSGMTFFKFQAVNVSGAVLWVLLIVSCGYFFGNIPIFRDHLDKIILLGIGVAVVPVALLGLWRFAAKMARK